MPAAEGVAVSVHDQLFRFVFSRPESGADGCALQAMDDALAADGRLGGARAALVASEAFRMKVDEP